MAADLTTSRDSAFGSCELDLDAAIVPAEVFASHKKFGTIARCDSSVRAIGVRFQPYNAKEKRQWLQGGADRGFLRLYDPSSKLRGSIVLPCDMRTTARQICVKLSLPVDSLHYQLSGETVRRIAPGECPLSIQNDFLLAIGYDDPPRREQLGDSLSLGFLIRFFVGRPQIEDSHDEDALSTYCHIRRGRLLQKWTQRLCVLHNGRLTIYQNVDTDGETESVQLSKCKVELSILRSRGRCIKLSHANGRQTLFLAFDSVLDLNAWMARCARAAAKVPPISDLSNLQLECLPDQLFSVGSERLLTQLNLRKNNLRQRPCSNGGRSVGWLDDLARLQSLRSLNLADNDLRSFPTALLQLTALTELALAGNGLTELPTHIGLLSNLTTLNLSNNRLSWLPIELSECRLLSCVDLAFNEFVGVPDALLVITSVKQWNLAGNCIDNLTDSLAGACIDHVNRLTALPEWLTELPSIERVCADHNFIKALPERIFTNVSSLRTLIVNHNVLVALPVQIENCAIEVLHVHHNRLQQLPHELLASAHRLRVLNATQNFLAELPPLNPYPDLNKVQQLRLASNKFTNSVVNVVVGCRRLRTLDLSYNRLRHFEDSNLYRLSSLEELNISGNRLLSLPAVLSTLPNLQVLRAHSNCLTTLPNFSVSPNMTVLDVANNKFERLDIRFCLAENLKHLDLTCNPKTIVDHSVLDDVEEERDVSLVDIGHRDTDTPTKAVAGVPWQCGFSETSGDRNKLCISQVRQAEAPPLFAMIDGGLNDEIPTQTSRKLPDMFASQKGACSTEPQDALKYTMLKCHEGLESLGQKVGASIALVSITDDRTSAVGYRLSAANLGHCEAVLCRDGRPVALTVSHALGSSSQEEYGRIRKANGIVTETNEVNGVCACSRQLGCSFLYPAVLPSPSTFSTALTNADEFVVIASKGVWEKMSAAEIVNRVRPIANPVLAAKHVQDIAQAYDASGNLSILIVRFFFERAKLDIDTKAGSISASLKLPGARDNRLPVQSETHLNDSTETLSDSDVQSEPNGRPPREKPNYYFEYKKKLKELMVESDVCLPDEQQSRVESDAMPCSSQEQAQNTLASNNAADQTFTAYQLICRRRRSQNAKASNGHTTSDELESEDENSPAFSRKRFEAARRSLIDKLQLRAPVAKHN
uniref:PPM-type phosphatase domain-containing protein n=1 Tax=Plectus sambesii TaxID=2011161 RepID=A0A914ULP1_9BILA